jgi:hypothetical protein
MLKLILFSGQMNALVLVGKMKMQYIPGKKRLALPWTRRIEVLYRLIDSLTRGV